MAVAILAPLSIANRLRQIATGIADVYHVQSLEALEAAICEFPVDLVILDPEADGTMRLEETSELILKHPTLYFILYTSLRPTSVATVLRLSKLGVKDVLTQGVDDSPAILREKLRRLECTALARTNINALLPPLADISLCLAKTIQRMFEQPERYSSAADLARDAGVPLSRLYRAFELAHLASPRHVLIAAKVWHGYSYLTQSDHSVREVASKLGYSQPRIFVSHVMIVFGVPPSSLRAKLPLGLARQRLCSWLTQDHNEESSDLTLETAEAPS